MYISYSIIHPHLLHNLAHNFHSRRLILHSSPQINPPDQSQPYPTTNNFDSNVIMVLSILICALIFSLCLNSIIKCALNCSTLISRPESGPARLPNSSIERKAIATSLIVQYSTEKKSSCLDTECLICLSEFAYGECIRILPKCNHGFHVTCIDKWLSSHLSCPKCRQKLADETCKKIIRCGEDRSSEVREAVQERIVRIELEHEGFIRMEL